MGRHRQNENRTEQFAKWIYPHRLLPAWKSLTFPARDAYFHLAVRCFAETAEKRRNATNNNGALYRSLRSLADDMGCSVKTAGAALADLQAKGWIVCTNEWERGLDGKGKTATFRLTMMPMPGRTATKEPERWSLGHDYPVLVYASYLPKPRSRRLENLSRKQNPPPHSGTVVQPKRTQLKAIK
ncbi:helix-turn-helix domain-containing protein [Rhodobacter aestuarii]|nr:helix-turn-helix domain-containing protein [Rhodobacter aestuarii]